MVAGNLVRITEASSKVAREIGDGRNMMVLMRATIGAEIQGFARSLTFAEPGISTSPVLSSQETRRGTK